jgi:hypothetical protein
VRYSRFRRACIIRITCFSTPFAEGSWIRHRNPRPHGGYGTARGLRRAVSDADDLGLYAAAAACLARGRFVTKMATRRFQIADDSGGSGAAGLSATRTIWASTPLTPVRRADVVSPTWLRASEHLLPKKISPYTFPQSCNVCKVCKVLSHV